MGQSTHINYYYINDLDRIHFACKGLPYEDKDQKLLIDDEPNKAIQNPKWNGFFHESFRRCELSKNKVQWLDLASYLWSTLKGLLIAKIVDAHFSVIVKFSKPLFSS
jgi:hypothetical protein